MDEEKARVHEKKGKRSGIEGSARGSLVRERHQFIRQRLENEGQWSEIEDSAERS